jgi:hypothetical protein
MFRTPPRIPPRGESRKRIRNKYDSKERSSNTKVTRAKLLNKGSRSRPLPATCKWPSLKRNACSRPLPATCKRPSLLGNDTVTYVGFPASTWLPHGRSPRLDRAEYVPAAPTILVTRALSTAPVAVRQRRSAGTRRHRHWYWRCSRAPVFHSCGSVRAVGRARTCCINYALVHI